MRNDSGETGSEVGTVRLIKISIKEKSVRMKDMNVGDVFGDLWNGMSTSLIASTSIKTLFMVSFGILGLWVGGKVNEDFNRWS